MPQSCSRGPLPQAKADPAPAAPEAAIRRWPHPVAAAPPRDAAQERICCALAAQLRLLQENNALLAQLVRLAEAGRETES